MSDLSSENTRPPLEDYYDDDGGYAARRFPKAKTRRARQNLAKKLGLPLIYAGHSVLIDPVAGDNRLRQLALYRDQPEQQQRRGPGRPRTVNAITQARTEFRPEPERRRPGRPRTPI